MDKEDIQHIGAGMLLAILSLVSLYCELPLWVSALSAGLLCLYIVLLIIECAHRSKYPKDDEKIFKLPNRAWAFLLVILLTITNVCAFANMYIKSEGVTYKEKDDVVIMTDKEDAIYFSSVTVTTLGYGDFTPTKDGRIYVVLHLASGLLLLFFIVPVIIARVSSW